MAKNYVKYRVSLIFVLSVVLQLSFFLPLPTLALGTQCTGPLGPGTADPESPYWFETIKKQGTSAFNTDPSYKVFRNVKDYGAVGDGITDDTDAINNAIAEGDRCGLGCDSSTLTPAVVYFPSGTYLVSSPIIAWYYTALVGDAKDLPTLLVSPKFKGIAVIDADPYIPDGYGAQWYINQNNFFRSFRNFVIDLRGVDPSYEATGLHWQVSQATSLTNVLIRMSSLPKTQHRGIFIENGSGGFMGDLVIEGGQIGMNVGNQQFTVRNVTIRDAGIGISFIWNWGWTFQRLTIENCVQAGVYMRIFSDDDADTPITGGSIFLDVDVQNTPAFILTSASATSPGRLETGSLVLDNIKLTNVPFAVQTEEGAVILAGGTVTIDHWSRRSRLQEYADEGEFVRSQRVYKPPSLLDPLGNIFGRTRPVYANYGLDQIASVKDHGAKGDGVTDDTAALQRILNDYAGCKIIYFDAGTYIVTDTLVIPPGSRIIGEIWTELMGSGLAFGNIDQPKPVIRVGNPCSRDVLEITDMLFSTRGPAPGAIVIEWNAADPPGMQGAVGMWDSHIRLGGTLGSHLGAPECKKQTSNLQLEECFAAFLALHLTPSSSGYFEATWIWLGDHDLDNDHDQITAFSGRGLFSESKGPVWLVGTGSEHHVLYQFNLVNAEDHYMGLIQTETPYYQPEPAPPAPYPIRADWSDPEYYDGAAWSLRVASSLNILVYGAGFYSFFKNYDAACVKDPTNACQRQSVTIDSISRVTILNLATIGTTYQLTVNGVETALASENQNGFAAMLTSWSSAPRGREALCNKNRYTEAVVFPTFDVELGTYLYG